MVYYISAKLERCIMELKEAKEILNKAGFLMENYDEELKNAIEVQVGSFWKKYYDRIMSNEEMVQFIADAKDELSPDEMAEKLLDWDEELNEDFTQGVGAPLGADQGIPHSMQGCAVPMMRLGEPAPYGKIQKPYPGHRPPRPHQRHRPIGFFPVGMLMTPVVVRKKKKKKKKK